MNKLRTIINANLPKGFEECLGYGIPRWVVTHSIYPNGYHTTPHLTLPFMSLTSQKKFIVLYHKGIYAAKNLLAWCEKEYAKQCKRKLDMSKSCIRFKNIDDIPYELIAEICKKITPNGWVTVYENSIKR